MGEKIKKYKTWIIVVVVAVVGIGGYWAYTSYHNTSGVSTACDNPTIKGNISTSGEKIYHVEGQRFYSATKIDTNKGERWFCTESEAKDAGWRKSEK